MTFPFKLGMVNVACCAIEHTHSRTRLGSGSNIYPQQIINMILFISEHYKDVLQVQNNHLSRRVQKWWAGPEKSPFRGRQEMATLTATIITYLTIKRGGDPKMGAGPSVATVVVVLA